VLKGIERNPQKQSSVMQNFNKVLEYLRGFPRFNSRYLWAQRYMMEGNADVIWGFFDDIWYWFNNKISPFDPSHTA